MQTDFVKRKGNNQSCEVENKIFEVFGFLINLHVEEGKKVRSKVVISNVCFGLSHFFCMNEFKSLSPNVVKRSRLCFPIFILIIEAKDPYFSEVKEVSQTIMVFLFHFHIFGIFVEGRNDLANRGRLLIFVRVNNEVLKEWPLIYFVTLFLIDDEVDACFHFLYFINFIVDRIDVFAGPHFSELSVRVVL